MCVQDAVSSAREENNELEGDCVDNESDSESESNKCDGWDTQDSIKLPSKSHIERPYSEGEVLSFCNYLSDA